MLSEELSTDMDRITQLQDAILDLLTISHTAIQYITHKTQFQQISESIPANPPTTHAASPQEYQAAIEEFVTDIVRRSKDVETLIAVLPSKEGSGERATRIQELEAEMVIANKEYKDVLVQAEELLEELQAAMDRALGGETVKGKDTSIDRDMQ